MADVIIEIIIVFKLCGSHARIPRVFMIYEKKSMAKYAWHSIKYSKISHLHMV